MHRTCMTNRCYVALGMLIAAGPLWTVPAVGDDGQLSLMDGDRVIATYRADLVPSPKEDAPWYGRSGFIHPVRTPAGLVVTEAFPADHLHQHGLMFAWTSTVVGGERTDFWNAHRLDGHVEHVETHQADPDRIVVSLRHVHDKADPPAVVLTETWALTRVPHPTLNVFDLVSTQANRTGNPLPVAEYNYGGLCVRGTAAWADEVTFLTNEGKGRVEGNHSRARWVAMAGRVDGQPCGLACLDHPGNFRAPQPARLHPDFPYFSYAPAVAGPFDIPANEPYVSRYRFVAFDGKIDPAALETLWKAFAESE